MKIACLSFSKKGRSLGEKIKKLSSKYDYYNIDHYYNGEVEGGIKSKLGALFKEYQGLIFISATGIAVRFISPYIIDKTIDPAVVVVDDLGNFSISLLSGHIGGANQLAQWLSQLIGARPVITTATDNRGIEAIDLFAQKNGYFIESMEEAKKLTTIMVNGERVGFYTEREEYINYPSLTPLKSLRNIDLGLQGLIIVSSKKSLGANISLPKCRLIPKNINIGIGCRRGMEGKKIIKAIKLALNKLDLSLKGIKKIGTIEVKKEEAGIIEASKYFNVPLKIFSLDAIREVEDKFEKSQFVKDTIGVYSVSEPVAYLLGGRLLLRKERYNGITISISKEIES